MNQRNIRSSFPLFVVAVAIVGIVSFSCDKLPIGPKGPDPVGAAAPGQYMSFTDFRALYTGTADVTVPAGTKKIRGVIISNSANEAAGNFRLEDESGSGIYLYTVVGSPIYTMGAVLEIDAAGSGILTSYNGDIELKSVPQAKVIQLGGTLPVTARVATIAQIIANRNTWASSLVRINGVTSISQSSSNSTGITYNVTDATGTLSMFIRSASGITVNTSATSVTGYVSIFNTSTEIGIRSAADFQ
jgi:hypothetical protein